MSKIVKAVNVMVSNPDLITKVIKGENETEIFFIYDKKHPWSIRSFKDNFFLDYYPGNQDISSLAAIPDEYWEEANIQSITYTTKELGTPEALASFKELYTIVSEKVYGMDAVLDEIIGNDEF